MIVMRFLGYFPISLFFEFIAMSSESLSIERTGERCFAVLASGKGVHPLPRRLSERAGAGKFRSGRIGLSPEIHAHNIGLPRDDGAVADRHGKPLLK